MLDQDGGGAAARDRVRSEIEAALGRGVALNARVQLDIGLSGELFGLTNIRVRDLLEALGLSLPEGTQ